jgi:hypothetical protein
MIKYLLDSYLRAINLHEEDENVQTYKQIDTNLAIIDPLTIQMINLMCFLTKKSLEFPQNDSKM